MNWTAIVALIVKYGPTVVALAEKDAPQIKALIADIEAAMASGAPFSFFSVLLKWGPWFQTQVQAEQAQVQQFFADVEAIFKPPVVTHAPSPIVH